jgi:hypothetical protein
MLSSAGFDEVCGFYKKHLHIDVHIDAANLVELREIHARRHLHVHRSGIADAQYVREFGGQIGVGDMLSVEDSYLARAFNVLRSAARHLSQAADTLHPAPEKRLLTGNARSMTAVQMMELVQCRFRDTSLIESFFDLSRTIAASPVKVVLGDILIQAEIDGRRAEFTIVGTKEILSAFFKYMSEQADLEAIDNMSWRRLTPPAYRARGPKQLPSREPRGS